MAPPLEAYYCYLRDRGPVAPAVALLTAAAVFRGSSTLLLGVGTLEDAANGIEVVVRAGDAIIMPAGVSHCSRDFQGDYRYIGAYPKV